MPPIMKRFKKLAKSRKFRIVLAIALVLVGIFYFRGRNKNGVETSTIQRGAVREELILTGSVRAQKHAKLYFPTPGKISWVGVTEGQKIYRGQGLTSLDKSVLNATYQQALNNYRSYQAAAESTLDSLKDNDSDETFAQKAQRTAAEVARDNAYDALKAAKYNLDNATILAPFAGIVASLPFPTPGVNVTPADLQVEVVDPATIYFEVGEDQSDVTNVHEGQEVVVVLDSFPGMEFKGRVSFVSYTPKAGEAGTVYEVKVIFEKGTLGEVTPRIGMTGDSKFILSQKENVLFVPSEFINSDIKGRYLKVGNKNNKTYVEVGLEGEDKVEIIEGKVGQGEVVYD